MCLAVPVSCHPLPGNVFWGAVSNMTPVPALSHGSLTAGKVLQGCCSMGVVCPQSAQVQVRCWAQGSSSACLGEVHSEQFVVVQLESQHWLCYSKCLRL